MSQERTIEELINADDLFMPILEEWVASSTRPVEVLSADGDAGRRTLLALQVTTRSPLGAIAYSTGGLLVDRGWLRILGAGTDRLLRNLADWNGIGGSDTQQRLPGALLVADDALGGFFAINGGAFEGPVGDVYFLAPDTCEWEHLELSHTDWLHWVLTGDLDEFYESLRWEGWEQEVEALGADRAISVYPFLWTKAEPIERRSRRTIPIEEIWGLHAIELPAQLGCSKK